MRIPNASMHNVLLTCSYSVLLFCFSLGRKDKFRRNNRCVKSCYMYQETFTKYMMWRRQQYTIHFTGMCFMTLSIFCQIYLFICIIHKGLPSLWMCGIWLWWIMCTLQFMTNKSLVITHRQQHLRIHHLWCLIPVLKCNDMPLTYILCPLPQLSFVFFFLQLHQ